MAVVGPTHPFSAVTRPGVGGGSTTCVLRAAKAPLGWFKVYLPAGLIVMFSANPLLRIP